MSRRDPTEFIDTFGTVRRRLSALAAQKYATIELGPMQAKLLRHAGRRAPISQAELARVTDSDPALAGRVLGALLERGLVARRRSREDRREYVVELTAAGRRVCDRIEKLRAELAAELVGALDARDLDDFDRIAKKLLDATG
ncbi:MAG TPA: MarR family transcriptional regulator [Kofleriaceae bacterium]|nr:MarR family transcriptional regulator [Kofleriaceae bacterium]